jgi:hypothetical protein
MEAERRQYRRLLADNTAFIVFRPGFNRWGKIKDISGNGLSIEYITSDPSKEGSSTIDIFTSEDHFYLPKVSCHVVYDTTIFELHPFNQGLSQKRRCGLQFEELTGNQKDQIQFLLDNHAFESV